MFFTLRPVISILRFVGILNAAVWFGAAMFFTWAAAPVLFSQEMKDLLGSKNYPYFSGAIAQLVVARYFILQYVCGAIALLQLFFEWMFLGKAVQKFSVGLLLGLVGISLLGGLGLQPKLKELHRIKYGIATPADERERAASTFRIWHGVAGGMNLVLLAGLAIYLWRSTNAPGGPRFVSGNKFRT
jgi:hypothetical protein